MIPIERFRFESITAEWFIFDFIPEEWFLSIIMYIGHYHNLTNNLSENKWFLKIMIKSNIIKNLRIVF